MQSNQNLEQVLSTLRHHVTTCLDPLIPENAPLALLDFPNYSNVGDSAIYLGEIAYLSHRGCSPRYVADWQTYDAKVLRRTLSHGIILISGGGNFGDLYPHHQNFRERILRDFPDWRVIQLPQSIHFDNQSLREETQRSIAAHPDFHLVVREHVSLDQARRDYHTPVYLCPDMAFMLDLTKASTNRAKYRAAVLSRTDNEKIDASSSVPIDNEDVLVCDWLEEDVPRDSWLYLWATKRLAWPDSKWPLSWLVTAQHLAARRMAEERLERGIRLIHRGRTLVTDRLHAVVLGWMTGMPVFYADNRYRKLSNVLDAWLPGQNELQRFDSLDAALSAAIASTNR